MRLRNNPNALPELQASNYLIQDFPFAVDKTMTIELGMGKGEMVTQLAQANPDKFYIGIEKYPTVAHKAMKKAQELKLKNFKIICEDIKDLGELIKGKVNTVWLTFSDPWPKARHEARRLTYKKYLDLYKNIITNDGSLKFKTDNDKLFEYSVEHIGEYGAELINVTRDFHKHKASSGNVMTGYEKKWSELGKNINYLEMRYK